jgi:hypothetical protein
MKLRTLRDYLRPTLKIESPRPADTLRFALVAPGAARARPMLRPLRRGERVVSTIVKVWRSGSQPEVHSCAENVRVSRSRGGAEPIESEMNSSCGEAERMPLCGNMARFRQQNSFLC